MTRSFDVAVVGGGVGGLSAALGLARNGHHVTVLERDPAPGEMDHEQAFRDWRRKGVPQIRQGHFVLGRAKDMLDRNAPDVVEALAGEGIVPAYNPMLVLLSPDELQPGDDLTPIPTRRIPFEFTLRCVAEREPGIEIRSGTKVSGLDVERTNGLPRIRGVGLEDGSRLAADFVVDAGGRRSPVSGWLRELGARFPAEREQDCGITYYGRYFRARGDAPDPWMLIQSSGTNDYLAYVVFPGDRGTYGVVFIAPSWDRELRVLRGDDAWNAAAAALPSIAQWTNADFADALTPVDVTAGHTNVLRPVLDDGVPSCLGVVPVGDALCTTDARLAWGLSLGLTGGFAAADAIAKHGADPGDVSLAYSDAVTTELEACFRVAAANSRISIRRSNGTFDGPQDADEEREVLASAVFASPDLLFSDPVILRGTFRRLNLADSPGAVFEDPEFVKRLQALAATLGDGSAASAGPQRDELLRMLSRETVNSG